MAPGSSTLAQDLVHIHRVITRALNIDIVNGIEYLQTGFPSPNAMLGYTKFNRCLLSIIHSHLQAEELVAFPALRKVLPLAPYAQLTAEHRRIDSLLSLVPDLILDISGHAPQYGLRILIIILRKLSKAWVPHIELEEQYFSHETITEIIDGEVKQDINEMIDRFKLEYSRPPYWVIPFLLFNIDQADRTSLTGDFSSLIYEELNPYRWGIN